MLYVKKEGMHKRGRVGFHRTVKFCVGLSFVLSTLVTKDLVSLLNRLAHEGVQAACISNCGAWMRTLKKMPDSFQSMQN